MNIIITREEHNYLQSKILYKHKIGSQLYGTPNEKSDMDYLCIYQTSEIELYSGLPNYHQFQYKETEKNIDWIYTSELQFWKNLYSGDSTINADVILFTDVKDNKIEICRTYKVLKAFLGFAKRDIKQVSKNPKKIYHIARGLYCVQQLIDRKLPNILDIQQLYKTEHDIQFLSALEKKLRVNVNKMYEQNEIFNYYIDDCKNQLWQKLLDANNNKEFKY